MIKIKEIFVERKYRKKYNSLKIVYEDLLTERNILTAENEELRKEIRKLIRERNDLDGRNTKKELLNNTRLNGNSKRGKTSSTKDNGTSHSAIKREKVSTTTNKQANSTNKNN